MEPRFLLSGSFVTAVQYSTGGWPDFVASADLNGDGRADLVAANAQRDTVSILLGKGDGTFAEKVDFATGTGPRSVTLGDFNGDGKADLAVANAGGTTVSILLGKGDGTFAGKVDFVTGGSPYWVTAADFNEDGKADLAVVNAGDGTVSILMGHGDGTFAGKVDYATGADPYSAASADLNGDGKPDLAVADYNGNTLSVLLGHGDGSFAAKVDYATGGGPHTVTSADFSGDGKADLAVTNYKDNTVSILLGHGDGTFATKIDFATGAGPCAVMSADLSGDGKADLAVTNYKDNTVSILLGNGDGSFADDGDHATGKYPISVTSADFNGDGEADLAVANIYDNTVSVLLHTSVDVTPPSSSVVALPASTDFTSFTVTWSGSDGANGSGIANYDVFVSDNGSAFTAWKTATPGISASYAGQPDHTYRFYSIATDHAGNREAAPAQPDATITVVGSSIDVTAPSSSVVALPASTDNASFTVSWSGSDGASGSGIASYDVFVSDNGGAFTAWKTATPGVSAGYTGQTGHTYRFYSVATDNAGNREAAPGQPDAMISISSGVDVTPPSSSVVALPATTDITSFTVTWLGSDGANGSGIANYDVFASDNGGAFAAWKTATPGISATYTGQPGHTYRFYSVATDKAGNREAVSGQADATISISIGLVVDVTPPSSSVVALPASTDFTTFTVTWSGSDDASGSGVASYDVFVSDNGSAFIAWKTATSDTSATYTGQPGHAYRFYSVATDNLGNREAVPGQPEASISIVGAIVDVTPPRSSVAALPAYINSTTFTVMWSGSDEANGSGIAGYDVSVSDNGSSFIAWKTATLDTSATYTGQPGHTYRFYSVATDKAGNRAAAPGQPGTTLPIGSSIDVTAPSSSVAALPAYMDSTNFAVTWSGSDETNGSGVASYDVLVSDNGSAFTAWKDATSDTSASYMGQSGHTYRFYSVATDKAGNRAATPGQPGTMLPLGSSVDVTAPSSSVVALPASLNSTTFIVTWSGSDGAAGSGIAGYDVFVSDDDSAFTAWKTASPGTSATYTGQPGHTYRFYSVATDIAGNREAAPGQPEATISIWPTESKTLQGKDNKWAFTDSDGTPATITYVGTGQAVVERWIAPTSLIHAGDARIVTVNGSNVNSTLTIATRGTGTKAQTAIEGIVVHGSLRSITAATTSLLGNVVVDGTLGSLTMDDATIGSTISIGPRPAGDTKTATALAFDRVAEMSIHSATPVKLLTVAEWLDNDGTPDVISAPSIATLTVKGDKRQGLAGNFEADLDLGLAGMTSSALGSVSVAGLWDGATVTAKGFDSRTGLSIGSLKAGRVGGVSVTVPGGVGTISTSDWQSGVISAGWMGSIASTANRTLGTAGNVSVDLQLTGIAVPVGKPTLGSVSVAGLWDGATVTVEKFDSRTGLSVSSLKAGRVGGVSVTAPGGIGTISTSDWQSGVISAGWVGSVASVANRAMGTAGNVGVGLQLTGNAAPVGRPTLGSASIANDLLAGTRWDVQAGLVGSLTVGGTVRQSVLRSAGSVKSITVGASDGSAFGAGVPLDLLESNRHVDVGDTANVPQGTIGTFTVRGLKLAKGAAIPRFFVNSYISAGVGGLNLVNWDGQGGLFARSGSLRSISYKDTADKANNWVWPAPRLQVSSGPGDFLHIV